MSNALALAHVTQALALLIENNLRPEIDMAVSVETRKPPADPPTEPTITVFLYQAQPSSGRRNDDLPTRASDGTLLRRAAAAIDLHYVISAYGEETELVGQRLIGSVIRTLHEIPVLPADVIEAAAERPHLAGSDLAESAQRVRFTQTQLDIDETSKLWGMLHQTPYSFSVAYQGSLVLIEGRETPVPARPVRTRRVAVGLLGSGGGPGQPAPDGRTGAEPAAPDGGGTRRGGGARKAAGKTTAAERTAKKTAKKAAKKSAAKSVRTAAKKTAAGTGRSAAKKAAAKAAAEPGAARRTEGTASARRRSGPAASGGGPTDAGGEG